MDEQILTAPAADVCEGLKTSSGWPSSGVEVAVSGPSSWGVVAVSGPSSWGVVAVSGFAAKNRKYWENKIKYCQKW